MSVVLDVQGVSKRFFLRHNPSDDLKVRFLGMFHAQHRQTIEEFWALRDVSLSVKAGEVVGVVGRNGSGKSTLLKIVAGLLVPTSGRMLVTADSRIGALIELGVGFHPDLSGEENVHLSASVYGLSRAEIVRIYPQVVAYSGLGPFMDTPLKSYSTGMRMRLAFALAVHIAPDILLLDEILAVGDAEFRRQCEATIATFRREGKTMLLVSHATEVIRSLCDRVCVLDRGRLQFDGPVDEGLACYKALTS